MTLPADKYLIEAMGGDKIRLCEVTANPGHYPSAIAHARALERTAELEAEMSGAIQTCAVLERQADEAIAQRDEALERIAGLQLALAKMVAFEPPDDPDLALARKIVAEWWDSENDDTEATDVQCALAGIKAGRAGGGS